MISEVKTDISLPKKGNDINDYTNCHSERQRRIFIVKMLHFVQHDSEWMISEVQTDISLPKKMSRSTCFMTKRYFVTSSSEIPKLIRVKDY